MSKGVRFWIMEINFTVAALELECVWRSTLDVRVQVEVDINAKGGACWNCSVGIDVDMVMVVIVICLMSI